MTSVWRLGWCLVLCVYHDCFRRGRGRGGGCPSTRGPGSSTSATSGRTIFEAVSIVVSGGTYSWHYKEAALVFDPKGTGPGMAVRTPVRETPPGLQDPIAIYDTHLEGRAIIGGDVYHGSRVPQLRGRYVFADYSRLVSFPRGPNNYGRIQYLADEPRHGTGLRQGIETQGFPRGGRAAGHHRPGSPAGRRPADLAGLGPAEEAAGERYVMGQHPRCPHRHRRGRAPQHRALTHLERRGTPLG